MRAVESVQQAFRRSLPEIHAKRVGAVFAAVAAVVRCGSVLAARVGRSIATGTSHKHGIKRIDRLLSNTRLHRELDKFYGPMASLLLRKEKRPIILVDWTDLDSNKAVAITAALALNGRSVTIYAQTYAIGKLGSPRAHELFLQSLSQVLGDRKPIIVADAGFQAPFMTLVQSRGWDYVCRVRGRTYVGSRDEAWLMLAKEFHAKAGKAPIDVPEAVIGQTRGMFETRLVLADYRSQRAKKEPRLHGRRKRTTRAVKRAHEPWLLATSLREESAKRVLALYRLRMQIEATYRDIKCGRLGWGLDHARTRCLKKLAVQLLLAAIAALITIIAGLAAERLDLQIRYQANTTCDRRVLSLTYLGRLVLNETAAASCLDLSQGFHDLAELLALLASPIWGDS